MLRHLKLCGLNKPELVRVYCSILRSVIDFCSVVYGPQLTKEQSDAIERLQAQSLKIVFGFDKSYSQVLKEAGLQLLAERRADSIKAFAKKYLLF